MSEQYVLGEMLKIMIEQDTDLTVEITQGVGGGTSNIQPAMENGEFDLYPEYTGTGWNAVLKEDGLYEETMFAELQGQYQDNWNMEWLGMYGFNNTYGLAVRSDVAEQYGLKTYSDLAAVAQNLTMGAEYDFFGREDGYALLQSAYGINFANTQDMDISLKYQAVNQGQVDVIPIGTTDGQISISDIVILEDDRRIYPSYKCCNVIRGEVLAEYPQLRVVLEKFTNLINDEEMAQMNNRVEADGADPNLVAEEFLRSKGLLVE
jgi:osmoprotectant transport system permease protein